MTAVFLVLLKLSTLSYCHISLMEVPETYVDSPLTDSKRIKSTDLKFVVKVIVENQTLAVGSCINHYWVLTAKFFELADDAMFVTTWDHGWDGVGGQVRAVKNVVVNPLLNTDSCNYDIALLLMNESFTLCDSVGTIDYVPNRKPTVGDAVILAAGYPEGVQAKSIIVRSSEECDNHISYYLYHKCDFFMYCLHLAENIYGAPIILDDSLVGVVPSDIDGNKVVFQFIGEYNDWIRKIVVSRYYNSRGISIHYINYITSIYIIVKVILNYS